MQLKAINKFRQTLGLGQLQSQDLRTVNHGQWTLIKLNLSSKLPYNTEASGALAGIYGR